MCRPDEEAIPVVQLLCKLKYILRLETSFVLISRVILSNSRFSSQNHVSPRLLLLLRGLPRFSTFAKNVSHIEKVEFSCEHLNETLQKFFSNPLLFYSFHFPSSLPPSPLLQTTKIMGIPFLSITKENQVKILSSSRSFL